MPESHEFNAPEVTEAAYKRVAAMVYARIRAGEWAVDNELPTTREIAAEYGVSVSTAYHAMRHLRDQYPGLFRSVRGFGRGHRRGGGRYLAGDDNPDADPNGTAPDA